MAEDIDPIRFPIAWDFSDAMNDVLPQVRRSLKDVSKMVDNAGQFNINFKVTGGMKSVAAVLQDLKKGQADTSDLKGALKAVTEQFGKLAAAGKLFQPKFGGVTAEAKRYVSALEVLNAGLRGAGSAVSVVTKAWQKDQDKAIEATYRRIAAEKEAQAIMKLEENTIENVAAKLDVQRKRIPTITVDSPEMERAIAEVQRLESLYAKMKSDIAAAEAEMRAFNEPINDGANIIATLENRMHLFINAMKHLPVDSEMFSVLGDMLVKVSHDTDAANAAMQKYTYSTKETAVAAEQFRIRFSEAMADTSTSEEALSKKVAVLNEQMKKLGTGDPRKSQIGQTLKDTQRELEKVRKENELLAKSESKEFQAFLAAGRAKIKTLSQTESSLSSVTAKLAVWNARMEKADVGTNKWSRAAKEVNRLSEKLATLNASIKMFSTSSTSIDGIANRISDLNRVWNSLGKEQKFQGGTLTADASRIVNEYRKLTLEQINSAQSLDQIIQKEKEAAVEAQKLAEAQKRVSAALSSAPATIEGMREKITILTQEIERTEVGTSKWKNLNRELTLANQNLQRMAGNVGKFSEEAVNINKVNAALSVHNNVLTRAASKIAAYTSVYTVINFLKRLKDITAEFELQKVALGAIIQDSAQAETLFTQIKYAAVKSPFQVKDLVSYTKQLSAYRIETEKLYDTTMLLADVSAGLGVDMSRLILAYGQVKAASVLRGQELRQFTEAGIPLVQLLADKVSELNGEFITTGDVFDMISKREIPFKMIADIFDDMTAAGGRFFNMQEKQAKTLKGRLSNLVDTYEIALSEMGNMSSISSFMNTAISALSALAENWRKVSKVLGVLLASFVALKLAVIKLKIQTMALNATEIQRVLTTERLTTAQIKETITQDALRVRLLKVQAIRMKELATNNLLMKSWLKLKRIVVANPWLAVAAAIGAVVGIIMNLINKSRSLEDEIANLDKATESLSNSLSNLKILNEELGQYVKLQKELSLLNEDSKDIAVIKKRTAAIAQLRDIEKDLSKAIPSAVSGIDPLTGMFSFDPEKAKKDAEEFASKAKEIAKKAYDKIEKSMSKQKANLALYQKLIAEGGYTTNAGHFMLYDASRIEKIVKKTLKINDQLKDATAKQTVYLNILNETNMQNEQNIIDNWKEMLTDASKFSVKINQKTKQAQPIFTATEIEQYKTLDEALSDVAKRYNEATSQAAYFNEIISKSKSSFVASDILADAKTQFAEFSKEAKGLYNVLAVFNSWQRKLTDPTVFSPTMNKLTNERMPVFTADEIEQYSSLNDALEEVAKRYKESMEDLEKYKNIASAQGLGPLSPNIINDAKEQVDDLTLKTQTLYSVLQAFNMTSLLDGKGGDAPAFKNKYESELDLIQEIYEQYAKLREYMKEEDAKSKIGQIYGSITDIDFLDADAYKKKLESIKSEAIASMSKLKAEDRQTMQEFVDNLSKTIQDIEYDNAIKALEDKIKKVSDAVAKSREARDFFKNIFDKTQNYSLAKSLTDSVFGATDIKAALMDEVETAFEGLDWKKAYDASTGTFKWSILDNLLEIVPEKNRELAEEVINGLRNAEKEKIDVWVDELEKEKSILDKRVELHRQTAERIQEIELSETRSPSDKAALKLEYEKRMQSQEADLAYQAFKESPVYIKLFDNLDMAATGTLQHMKDSLLELRGAWGSLASSPTEMKELQSKLNELDAQLASRNPFKALTSSLKEYFSMIKSGRTRSSDAQKAVDLAVLQSEIEADYIKLIDEEAASRRELERLQNINAPESEIAAAKVILDTRTAQVRQQKVIVETGKEAVNQAQENSDEWENFNKTLTDSISRINEYAANVMEINNAIFDMISLYSRGDAIQKQYYQELNEGINNSIQGITDLGAGITEIMATDGFSLSGWAKTIKGVAGLAKGIQGLFRAGTNKDFNKMVDEQQKRIENLEYTFNKLKNVEQKVFGTEFIRNYNEELGILRAKQTAYLRMAEAERDKGKAADKAKIKEYENAARDAADNISDMYGQISQRMFGTDVTSAARDFATAWIDAKKSFSNTTEAMQGKFEDLIKNMVIESMAAKLVETILSPLFKQMDELGADASAGDVVKTITDFMATNPISKINDAMEVLLAALQAQGIDITKTAGKLSGTAKEVSNASEESIQGLAAGINTQNFYMSGIYSTVNRIYAMMEANAIGVVSGNVTSTDNQLYETYFACLPRIESNTADMVAECKNMTNQCSKLVTEMQKVVKPKNGGYRMNVSLD